eukprot:756056-Hanusia_phi.AAC.1
MTAKNLNKKRRRTEEEGEQEAKLTKVKESRYGRTSGETHDDGAPSVVRAVKHRKMEKVRSDVPKKERLKDSDDDDGCGAAVHQETLKKKKKKQKHKQEKDKEKKTTKTNKKHKQEEEEEEEEEEAQEDSSSMKNSSTEDGRESMLSKAENGKKKEKSKRKDNNEDSASKQQSSTSQPGVVSHSFETTDADHAETPREAYEHVLPLLHKMAEAAGKTPSDLRIYDPFFCTGSMKRHLAHLGFTNVYNQNEDFYETVKSKKVPEHDVVVTNPPYSLDHIPRFLRWLSSNDKPWLLLVPNYVYTKDYFSSSLRGRLPMFLTPPGRYVYESPKQVANAQGQVSLRA